mmetsp:Transcript_49493/g.140212  ORF Transcript_49493/g.140212 Transcript_49493/m.140212 type:complete len:129 (+) Transcript_49493:113-499(+)
MAEVIIAGAIVIGGTTAIGGVVAGVRTAPGPRSVKLLAGSVALATACYIPNSFKIRRQFKENKQASKFLRTFDDPLYGAPLAIAGVLAGGFAAGHSSRAAFSAARAAFRGGAKPPSGAKPKSSVRPPK